MENAFNFQDYTESELLQALDLKMAEQDLTATETAKTAAGEVLGRLRNRPNFGNIGEVENLLSKAKLNIQSRQSKLPLDQRRPEAPFEPQDFDPDFDRYSKASENLIELFADLVDCDEIVKKLSQWQQMARSMKSRGLDYRKIIPTNFIFKGPPGGQINYLTLLEADDC